jgi:S-methylmethionine-dependent homocysteine/selenocysteine methylase
MTFKCKNCDEKFSNSKMAGMAITSISQTILNSKKISTSTDLSKAFDRGEFSAGILTGLVNCPKCNKSNWS